MTLADDPFIFKIALCAKELDSLLDTEREMDDLEKLVGTYWYIGRRGEMLFRFQNNLDNHTVERVKRYGKLNSIYTFDLISRVSKGSC